MIKYEDEWLNPVPVKKVAKKQKGKIKRAIRKQFKALEILRATIIEKHYIEHYAHSITKIDTHYENDVFVLENISCSCNVSITITQEILEKTNGKPYKIIHAA